MKHIYLLFIALPLLFLVTNCSKEDSKRAPAKSYRWQGNQCFDNSNQIVDYNLCQNQSGYRWNGSQCLNSSGTPVHINYCNTTGNGQTQNGMRTEICGANHTVTYMGYPYRCDQNDCSGYLAVTSTGQQVQCQCVNQMSCM